MEQVNLNTTFVVDPRNTATFTVDSLLLNWKDKRIVIHLGGNAVQKTVTYEGSAATTLMVALNKANLTTNSLHKRIFTQLIADGHIDGDVTGSPD